MSVTDNFDEYCMAEPLKKLVEDGKISEKVIDEKVIRILMLMKRLHMLNGARKSGIYNTQEHWQAALDVARESCLFRRRRQRSSLSSVRTRI